MFWILLLAHLVADYPLQPSRLVLAKRHQKGLIAHAAVHVAVTCVLLLPYLTFVWPAVLALGLVHWFIDDLKIRASLRWPDEVVLPYFLDQFVHIITLVLIALWMGQLLGPQSLPPDPDIFIFLSGFLLATYVWYITELVVFYKDARYQAQLDEQHWYRMIFRTIILLTTVRLSQSFYSTPVVAAGLPYIQGQFRLRVFITDLLVSIGGAVFIWIAIHFA